MRSGRKPVKILRLIARLNVGGPAQHVVWLSESLHSPGYETLLVTGVVPTGEEDMSAFAAAHGVVPLVLPSMSRELSPRDVITIWRLWRLMVRFGPDVVHTHTAKAGAVGRLAGLLYKFAYAGTLIGRPRRCRFVHTFHGHVFHSYYGRMKTSFFLLVERMLARLNTDRIVVLSSQQASEIRNDFHIGRESQYAVIPLGIDLDAVRNGAAGSLRNLLAIDPSEPIVAIVGRLTAIKNHDLFLETASKSRSKARFVIFGDGAERSRLEALAVREVPAGRILFAGTQDPGAIFASIDVAMLTSRNEGTPLALIEAMACGRPVVSTAVGGVVDLLGRVEREVRSPSATFEIRERGITAASGDAAGLAAGLDYLFSDADLRARYSRRGVEYVDSAHSRNRLVADVSDLYETLMEERTP